MKLFGSILDSSIWLQDDKTRILWITMLAMANKNGLVEAARPNIAIRAQISPEDCIKAMEKLCSPDPESKTSDYEGRRVEKVDGGYQILNYRKYREMGMSDARREYLREKKRESRNVNNVNNVNKLSTVHSVSASASESASDTQNTGPKVFTPPTLEEVASEALAIGLPQAEAEKMHAYYESNGWKVGKNKMKVWKQSLRGWKLRYDEQHRGTGKPNPRNIGFATTDEEASRSIVAAIAARKAAQKPS